MQSSKRRLLSLTSALLWLASQLHGATNISGPWVFSGQSSVFTVNNQPLPFSANGQLTQDKNSFSGDFGIIGTPCGTGGTLSGTVSDSGQFNATLAYGNFSLQVVTFVGAVSVDGNSASGSYSTPLTGCTNGDYGTWSARRTSGSQLPPPAVGQILPQFAFGGGWYSALYFTNTGANSLSFAVSFVGDNGLPLTVPSIGGSATVITLASYGTAVIEAQNSGPLVQGYALVSLPNDVESYGVLRQSVAGRADQEAVVPLSNASYTSSTLTWDETVSTTSVAIVNPNSTLVVVSILIRNSLGSVIGTSGISLPAKTKVTTVLKSILGLNAMTGNRGSAYFLPSSGNIAVLGLRFGDVAFTSIPTYGK
jgi:hypothetical protein